MTPLKLETMAEKEEEEEGWVGGSANMEGVKGKQLYFNLVN